MLDWIFTPVRLNRDQDSPSLPLWAASSALLIPIGISTVLIVVSFGRVFTKWAPFAMFGAGAVLAVYIFYNRSDAQIKRIKAILDISWNTWSFAGAVFLFYVVLNKEELSLQNVLVEAGSLWKTLAFVLVCITACGRVALPVSELLKSLRPMKVPS